MEVCEEYHQQGIEKKNPQEISGGKMDLALVVNHSNNAAGVCIAEGLTSVCQCVKQPASRCQASSAERRVQQMYGKAVLR